MFGLLAKGTIHRFWHSRTDIGFVDDTKSTFYGQKLFSWPKIVPPPPTNFSHFKQIENILIDLICQNLLFEKWMEQPPCQINSSEILPQSVQRIWIRRRKFWNPRWKGSRVVADSLMVRTKKPPPPPAVGKRVNGFCSHSLLCVLWAF